MTELEGVNYILKLVDTGETFVSSTREESMEKHRRLREKYGPSVPISLRVERKKSEDGDGAWERNSEPNGLYAKADAVVYFIQNSRDRSIKIGSAVNPSKRLSSLKTGSADNLILLAITRSYSERDLHRRFKHLKIRGEWYRPEPDLLEFIKYDESVERSEESRVFSDGS